MIWSNYNRTDISWKNTTKNKNLVVFFVVKPNKYVDSSNIQMYNDNIKGGKYYEEGF